jgi:hypothetical protein
MPLSVSGLRAIPSVLPAPVAVDLENVGFETSFFAGPAFANKLAAGSPKPVEGDGLTESISSGSLPASGEV